MIPTLTSGIAPVAHLTTCGVWTLRGKRWLAATATASIAVDAVALTSLLSTLALQKEASDGKTP